LIGVGLWFLAPSIGVFSTVMFFVGRPHPPSQGIFLWLHAAMMMLATVWACLRTRCGYYLPQALVSITVVAWCVFLSTRWR